MNEKPLSEAFLERVVGGEVELAESGQRAFKPQDYPDPDARAELVALTDRELLGLYGRVLDTLRVRGTIRCGNNPVADYAEDLCAKALNLKLANKSATGYDGTDPTGNRIEIKARRITRENGSRQLSAIRGIDSQHSTPSQASGVEIDIALGRPIVQ